MAVVVVLMVALVVVVVALGVGIVARRCSSFGRVVAVAGFVATSLRRILMVVSHHLSCRHHRRRSRRTDYSSALQVEIWSALRIISRPRKMPTFRLLPSEPNL